MILENGLIIVLFWLSGIALLVGSFFLNSGGARFMGHLFLVVLILGMITYAHFKIKKEKKNS